MNRIINFNDQIPLPRPEQPPPTPKHKVWGRHPGEVLIQIEFSQIEDRSSRVPFIARLIDLESQPGKRDIKIRSFGYLDRNAVVRYDPPGTASIYVSRENAVLGRSVIMQWVTTSERRLAITHVFSENPHPLSRVPNDLIVKRNYHAEIPLAG